MKRLFVAIDFPEAIKAEIQPLCADLSGARWVSQSQMHLTLRFIGDANEPQLKAIQTGLATIHATPFQMTLQSVGQFPHRGKPRVLWVGVEAEPVLHQLQAMIEHVIRDCGFEPANHDFSPHITLARFKTPPPAEQLTNYFNVHRAFKGETFTVTGFVLYSSQLSANGSVYHIEGFYQLG